jgi:hypothetical protein
MSALELLVDFVMPIGGSLFLAVGLVSWQRSGRFLSGLSFRPKRWEAVAIVVGAAVMASYVAFVVPYDSAALRSVTVLLLVLPAVGAACLARHSRPAHRDKSIGTYGWEQEMEL